MILHTDEHVSLLHKTFGIAGEHRLCVVALAGFSLQEGTGLLPDQELWTAASQAFERGRNLDPIMPKPLAEVLMAGKCMPPEGQPATHVRVLLKVGPIAKELVVCGDRRFSQDGQPTRPAPFTSMDMDWSRAYGGASCKNSDGRTLAPDGSPGVPPNVEYPGQLMLSVKDAPEPAGFGPLGASWPWRLKGLGTFKDDWRMTCWPGLPGDFDFGYFNQSPEDQRFRGAFEPGQEVVVCGMNAAHPRIAARLPRVRVRAFALRTPPEGGEVFSEVSLLPDTLWLFPNVMAGVLIHRGRITTADEESSDVVRIVGVHEPLDEPEKPASHYREWPASASEAGTQAPAPELAAPKPAPAPAPQVPPQTPVTLFSIEDQSALQQHIAGVQADIAAKEALLDQHLLRFGVERKTLESGLESMYSGLLAGLPHPSGPETDAELARQIEALSSGISSKEEELRAKLMQLGVDPDNPRIPNPVAPEAGPGNASETIEYLKSKGVRNEDLFQQLRDLEREHAELQAQRAAYDGQMAAPGLRAAAPSGLPPEAGGASGGEAPASAGLKPAGPDSTAGRPGAPPPGGAESGTPEAGDQNFAGAPKAAACPASPGEVEAWAKEGRSMAGCDLSGFNLSGRKLRGALLREAILEGADLSAVDLSEADLSGARMAGANLAGASLRKVNARSASLPRAGLQRADLTHACLAFADLNAADATNADFSHGDFSHANLSDAVLKQVRAKSLQAPGASFSSANLREADLQQASLLQADFSAADMTDASLQKANLQEAMFYDATARNADFTEAGMVNSRADGAATFQGAKLVKANLEKAAWLAVDVSNADLSACRLTDANMAGSGFAKSRLDKIHGRWANLDKADFKQASLNTADLFEASLRQAGLQGTDVRGGNLYGADLYKIKVDRNTRPDGANIQATLLADRIKT